MHDNLNQYERVFAAYLRYHGIQAVSLNQADVKALAKRNQLRTPDFRIAYGNRFFIVDVKGSARDDNWVERKAVDDLAKWQLFYGRDAISLFVFVHRVNREASASINPFGFDGTEYHIFGMTIAAYMLGMRRASVKWKTVRIPRPLFKQCSKPLTLLLEELTH